MRAVLVVLALVVTAVGGRLAIVLDAATGPIPLNCNRACLEGVVDQYLAALVAHDPKRAPLSKDAKYTENNQVIDVGDGFWKTVQGIGKYRHYFADPEIGQVAFMGTMMEAGAPLLHSLRMRIEPAVSPRSSRSTSSRAAADPTTSRRWRKTARSRTCGSSRLHLRSDCHARR
jgi:hypothetical protein